MIQAVALSRFVKCFEGYSLCELISGNRQKSTDEYREVDGEDRDSPRPTVMRTAGQAIRELG